MYRTLPTVHVSQIQSPYCIPTQPTTYLQQPVTSEQAIYIQLYTPQNQRQTCESDQRSPQV